MIQRQFKRHTFEPRLAGIQRKRNRVAGTTDVADISTRDEGGAGRAGYRSTFMVPRHP